MSVCTHRYIWSGLLVLLGIFLNVYSKNPKSFDIPSLRSKLLRLLLEGSKVLSSSKQIQVCAKIAIVVGAEPPISESDGRIFVIHP